MPLHLYSCLAVRAMVGDALWEYEDDGSIWKPMPSFYATMHEDKLSAGDTFFEYDGGYADGAKCYHYEFDLENFIQTNCKTKKARRLRRLVVSHVGKDS